MAEQTPANGRHHEHSHSREHAHAKTVPVGYATIELSSHMHEQAATVSATVRIADGQALPFARVVEAIAAIAGQAEAAGGIVGHIKGYAEASAGFARASCTGADLGVNVEGNPGLTLDAAAKVQLVAIVMLVDLHDLESTVVDSLS